jgi:hypothetical protein
VLLAIIDSANNEQVPSWLNPGVGIQVLPYGPIYFADKWSKTKTIALAMGFNVPEI